MHRAARRPSVGLFLLSTICVIGVAFLTLVPSDSSGRAAEEAGAVSFTEKLIRDKYSYSYGIAAADLDGDGDLDLVSADATGEVLYWFENDGKGGFSARIIKKNEPGWFERNAVGDINGDGRPDVAVVKNKD